MLPAMAKLVHGQKLLAVANSGADYALIVTDVIQHFCADMKYCCVADVSLLLLMLDDPFALTISAVQLAGAKSYAYDASMTYKGRSFHITLAGIGNDEVTRVLILERIEELSLPKWEDSFPEHVHDEHLPETSLPVGYEDLLNKTQAWIKLQPYGIINSNKHFIMHLDLHQENILVTPSFEDSKAVNFWQVYLHVPFDEDKKEACILPTHIDSSVPWPQYICIDKVWSIHVASMPESCCF
ncbi:hypothetical protein EV421DRAFT_1914356 [Armillaria borealis]|uniref:Uncharacterized protein n=1 Tax=Armillaria borealis TaxID=47425 RepID=A0AA39MDB0_9AGAR|nr:hypothetical protein EV421DRAFT_1914356 [Armillaria borealis]